MPSRPAAHVTADRAVNAVTELFTVAGHAVERVGQDYGEDLLVQTAHRGRMDASRLWLQVKGTENADTYRNSNGELAYQFPVRQVLRWVRTADPVLVVLWDVNAGTGWHATPHQIDPFTIFEQKHATLRFFPEDVLDGAAIEALVWTTRTIHYESLIAWEHHVVRRRQLSGEPVDPDNSVIGLLALDFLMLVGVVEDLGEGHFRIRESTRNRFVASVQEMKDQDWSQAIEDDDPDPGMSAMHAWVLAAAMATVLPEVQEVTGEGMPDALLEACCYFLASTLGAWDALAQTRERYGAPPPPPTKRG